MSKRRRRPSPPPPWSTASPSPPSDDGDWHAISEILDERRKHGRLEYLVDWEGKDPRTGEPYDQSWISASEVTLDARAEWASKKRARLQGASPRPITRLLAEDSSCGRTSAHSSQGQPRAVSLQTEDRAPKRRRLRRAVSDPSSPTSAATDSQDREYQPSQLWEASNLHTQARNAATLVVELPPAHHFDPSDYLSVHLSQASVEGATQSSPSAQPSQRHAVSQRTIPDSQESLSHDTPNDPRLESEGLRAALGLPLPRPVSTFDSWPSILSGEQGREASQVPEVVPGNSLSELLRRSSAERREPEGISLSGSNEHSEPSIPARQIESFPNHTLPDGQGADNPSSHSAEHDSFQTNRPHSSLTRVSEQASSGPHFYTQPHSVFPLPSASSSGPTNLGDKDSSAVPDSLYKSDRIAKSAQEQQSDNSHGADYGSAQPRGSVYYASQVVSNLLDSSHLLTGPDNSSIGDYTVPETVPRKPRLPLNPAWAESSPEPHSQQSGIHFAPERAPESEEAELVDQQSPRPFVTPPPMDGAQQPHESPAIAELRRIQRESLLGSEAPSLLGFPESAPADDGPHRGDHPSPPRNLHDPVMFSTAAGDAQPNTMSSSLAPGSIPRPGAEASETISPLFQTQEQVPSHGDAMSQAEFGVPVTVAPSDIQPQELNPLTVAPLDITTSVELPSTGSRHLPGHGAVFPGRHLDTQTNLALSMQENEADEPEHRLPDDEPKEFTVTLPFPANQRPFYDGIIMESRPDIESFCRIFSNEVLRTPKPSAVHKIEALFLKLLDICDYPPHLDAASWDSMSRKEVQNYLYESNAKFALIWDLLEILRDMPTKVLIVARSERLLSFMETLAVVEGYAFSRTGLQDMQFEHARSPLSIVLALPDQDLPDAPSDFDLVFGYDFEFRRSVFADRLAQLQPGQKHPMVLSLVIAHSLEHIDLCITDKDPDIPELDRKNALVVALTKIRGMIVNPEMGRAKPHEIAQHFASLLGGPAEPRDYEPVPLPESVLDVYLDPTQPEEGVFDDEDGLNSRKRKLGDFEENDPKRQKVFGTHVPMVNAKRVEAISSLLYYLGVEVLDGGNADDDVPVPRALLKAVEAKVHAEQKAQEEARVREQELKELKSLNASLSRQNEEYASTINTIQSQLQGAVEERGLFERQKNSVETRVNSLESRVQNAEEEKTRLAAEVADLKTKKDLGDGSTGAAPSVPGKDAEEAQAEVQRVKKQVENMERELGFTRDAYQTASHAASDLGNENRELVARNKDLEHRASDNLRQIHEANNRVQVEEYLRVQDELEVQLREREMEIERLREELKALKMRRETRQSSVPRSPRMGVMSPRAGRGASRGSSPALDSPGLPIFGQQGGNNSRWGHLRD